MSGTNHALLILEKKVQKLCWQLSYVVRLSQNKKKLIEDHEMFVGYCRGIKKDFLWDLGHK